MPQGRHRGEAVRRPHPRAWARRLPRDLQLSVASAGVAAAMLGTTTAVAGGWPAAGSGRDMDGPVAAIGTGSFASAARAYRLGAELRAEERTSRDRSGTLAASATPSAPGPVRPPASAKSSLAVGSVPAGVSGAPCPISSSIEVHLTANARAVYRAVCAAFGHTVSSFGGYRPGSPGDHGTGRAVDIMVSGDPGLAIARYVQEHAVALHVTYVIYQQKIWMAGDPFTQWKQMADRGSRTANHYDHVHVSVA